MNRMWVVSFGCILWGVMTAAFSAAPALNLWSMLVWSVTGLGLALVIPNVQSVIAGAHKVVGGSGDVQTALDLMSYVGQRAEQGIGANAYSQLRMCWCSVRRAAALSLYACSNRIAVVAALER